MLRFVVLICFVGVCCPSGRADVIYRVDHTFGSIRMHGTMSVDAPKTIVSIDDFLDYTLTWEDNAPSGETTILRSKSGIPLQLEFDGASLIAGANDLRSIVTTPVAPPFGSESNLFRISDSNGSGADGFGQFEQSVSASFFGVFGDINLRLDGLDADTIAKTQTVAFSNEFQLGVAVPEPTSLALLATTGSFVVLRRRRRGTSQVS